MEETSVLHNLNSDQFREIMGIIPEGLVIIDENYSPVFINSTATEILQPKAEPSSLRSTLLKTLSFDPLNFNEKTKRELVINDLVLHVYILPFLENNRKKGAAVFFHDISMFKEAEKLKTDFVSIVSHELRNPLTAIKNALSILFRICGGENAEKQERFLNIVTRNVERINSLINQYLDITRTEAGKMSFQFKKVNLTEFIDGMMEDLKERAASKKLSLEVDIPPGFPHILADSPKLEQIFFNLVGNAVKFTNEGGCIVISAKEILHSGKDDGDAMQSSLEVTVADTGIGIPKEKRELIFDKFYRVKNSITIDKEGVGLGLSIVHQLVGLHGGTIHVEGNEPTGSRFCFTMPIYAGERRDPGFRRLFDGEFRKAKITGAVLSLLTIIIEGTPVLEAELGKTAVESILKDIEAVVKKSLYRQSDIAVQRRKKEMFAVFCDSEKEGATSICERMKKNIEQAIEKQFTGRHQDFGVRIGLATYPDDAADQKSLFRKALSNAQEEGYGEKEDSHR